MRKKIINKRIHASIRAFFDKSIYIFFGTQPFISGIVDANFRGDGRSFKINKNEE